METASARLRGSRTIWRNSLWAMAFRRMSFISNIWVGAVHESPLRFHIGWMIFIFQPFQGVVFDVFANFFQVDFIANHVFVIITLPDRLAAGGPEVVDLFGRHSVLKCPTILEEAFSGEMGSVGIVGAVHEPPLRSSRSDDPMEMVGHDHPGIQFHVWDIVAVTIAPCRLHRSFPHSFNCIFPSMISPNKHSRFGCTRS